MRIAHNLVGNDVVGKEGFRSAEAGGEQLIRASIEFNLQFDEDETTNEPPLFGGEMLAYRSVTV